MYTNTQTSSRQRKWVNSPVLVATSFCRAIHPKMICCRAVSACDTCGKWLQGGSLSLLRHFLQNLPHHVWDNVRKLESTMPSACWEHQRMVLCFLLGISLCFRLLSCMWFWHVVSCPFECFYFIRVPDSMKATIESKCFNDIFSCKKGCIVSILPVCSKVNRSLPSRIQSELKPSR